VDKPDHLARYPYKQKPPGGGLCDGVKTLFEALAVLRLLALECTDVGARALRTGKARATLVVSEARFIIAIVDCRTTWRERVRLCSDPG